MMVGGAFKIVEVAGASDKKTDEAQKYISWALFGMKCNSAFAIILSVLVDLCFLCHLRGKIKLFVKYNEGNQDTSNPQLLSS